ncbi:MAG: hypothetical protein ABMA64_18230 [Myxococcota bacterium]
MGWWLLLGSAHAASVAGLAVPGVGGGFAGPAAPGVLGVYHNPSAAAFAPRPELALDLGLLHNRVSQQLDTWDAPQVDPDLGPQPSLMAAVPIGRFAVGAAFAVPWLRGGASPPDGPQRLFTVSSTLSMIEGDLIAAARPVDWLGVGATLRVGQFTYASSHAIDTGVLLNGSLDPEPPLPIGEPLLEGTQAVEGVQDLVFSWAAGLTVGQPDGPSVAVSYRPPWVTRGEGTVVFVPSRDLLARIDGRVQVEFVLPASLAAGGRVPVGPVVLLPEFEWFGWSRTGHVVADVRGLALTSADPVLDSLLAAAGLDQADFVTSQQGKDRSALDWRDSVNVGAQVAWVARPPFEVRGGVFYASSAVRERSVNPSNLDFARWDLRAAGSWQAAEAARFGLSADWFPGSPRIVTTSVYTQQDPGSGDLALPSGNGRYTLGLWRLGATVVLGIPSRGDR